MKLIPFKRRRRNGRGLSPHNIVTGVFILALAACAGYASVQGAPAKARQTAPAPSLAA